MRWSEHGTGCHAPGQSRHPRPAPTPCISREETPSQLLDDHTPSERSASSGGEEGELSDYETPEESDEEAAALMAKAALTSPRRQSTRQRRGTAPVLRELSSSSGSSSGESEGEEAGAEGRPRSKAGAGGKQRRRQQQEEEGAAKSPGGADGKQKRASFVVVQEDAAAAGGGQILLPSMRPVPVVWAAGEEALCSVCGDGEDAEGWVDLGGGVQGGQGMAVDGGRGLLGCRRQRCCAG